MKKIIMSPFFSMNNDSLIYLNKFEICKLPSDKEIRRKILHDEGALFYQYKNIKKDSSIIILEPHPVNTNIKLNNIINFFMLNPFSNL